MKQFRRFLPLCFVFTLLGTSTSWAAGYAHGRSSHAIHASWVAQDVAARAASSQQQTAAFPMRQGDETCLHWYCSTDSHTACSHAYLHDADHCSCTSATCPHAQSGEMPAAISAEAGCPRYHSLPLSDRSTRGSTGMAQKRLTCVHPAI